jgi:hypothetical protein
MIRGRALCAVLAGASAALGPTQASAAGTVSVTADGRVVYQAAAGERNDVDGRDPQDGIGTVAFFDPTAGIVAGSGCSGNVGQEAYCSPAPGVSLRLDIRTGDRNDSVDLEFAPKLPATVKGGPGDDELTGLGASPAIGTPIWLADEFRSAGGSRSPLLAQSTAASSVLWGGPGEDELAGGPGADRVIPGPELDYVVSGRGDDIIEAQDGTADHIDCQGSPDRLVLDRFDFPWGRCGPARRRGPTFVVPLFVDWDNDDLGGTEIVLGCPADSPSACRGKVTMNIRGRRRVFSGRYRIPPGGLGGPYLFFSDRTNFRLARRGAVVSLQGRDGLGRLRTLTRRLGVSYSWPPPV